MYVAAYRMANAKSFRQSVFFLTVIRDRSKQIHLYSISCAVESDKCCDFEIHVPHRFFWRRLIADGASRGCNCPPVSFTQIKPSLQLVVGQAQVYSSWPNRQALRDLPQFNVAWFGSAHSAHNGTRG